MHSLFQHKQTHNHGSLWLNSLPITAHTRIHMAHCDSMHSWYKNTHTHRHLTVTQCAAYTNKNTYSSWCLSSNTLPILRQTFHCISMHSLYQNTHTHTQKHSLWFNIWPIRAHTYTHIFKSHCDSITEYIRLQTHTHKHIRLPWAQGIAYTSTHTHTHTHGPLWLNAEPVTTHTQDTHSSKWLNAQPIPAQTHTTQWLNAHLLQPIHTPSCYCTAYTSTHIHGFVWLTAQSIPTQRHTHHPVTQCSGYTANRHSYPSMWFSVQIIPAHRHNQLTVTLCTAYTNTHPHT